MHDIKYIGAAGESLQLFVYAFILFDIMTYRVSLNDIQGRYENPVAYFRYNYSIKTNQLLDRVSFAKYWVSFYICSTRQLCRILNDIENFKILNSKL